MVVDSDENHPAIWRLERAGRLTFVGMFKWFVYVSCSFSMLIFIYALYDVFSTRTLSDFDVGTLMVVGAGFPICMGFAMRHECRKKKPGQERLRDLLLQVEMMDPSVARSRMLVEIAAMKYTLQGKGNISAHLLSSPELSDTSWPDAALLVPASLRTLPMPRSVNVPFEPLRLGHDRARCTAMLREFVMDPCPKPHNGGDQLYSSSGQKVYPASLANLIWMFGPVPLLLFLGMHITEIARAYFGLVGLGGGLLLTFASPLCWVWHGVRLSPFRKQCWILPGAILLRSGGIFTSKQKQAVFRRVDGMLWYDAQRKTLFIHASGKCTYYACSPTDGLFALWAWLNTASLPSDYTMSFIV